ncbi:MAG: di-trans,poly-cis-decaprenylcistransferase [Spirochaetales bacterium]|nr:di-trans,poly-cis-decaprenylcistransferase [Spirochaetales bacterium]
MAPGTIPRHVGIIMDGNGRWAESRGLKRSKGHREGVTSAKAIVKKAADLGLSYLSLYVFSTENWKRTQDEVSFLMILIKQYLKQEYQFYIDNRIRVIHSGRRKDLPADVLKDIDMVVEQTKDFTGLTVNLLINYGGRDEIVRSVKKLLDEGVNPSDLTEEMLDRRMDNGPLPPVDLIIRTGGDQRSSNFLLWSGAYSEYYFTEKLWPDFTPDDLQEAVEDFEKRNRRWGGYDAHE